MVTIATEDFYPRPQSEVLFHFSLGEIYCQY